MYTHIYIYIYMYIYICIYIYMYIYIYIYVYIYMYIYIYISLSECGVAGSLRWLYGLFLQCLRLQAFRFRVSESNAPKDNEQFGVRGLGFRDV